MKILSLLFILISALFGGVEVKIATYNVESLFDLEKKDLNTKSINHTANRFGIKKTTISS